MIILSAWIQVLIKQDVSVGSNIKLMFDRLNPSANLHRNTRHLALLILLSLSSMTSSLANADLVTVAAAANFKTTLEKLALSFEADNSQHKVRIVTASTGILYNQINHGAPFDLFLSADAIRADKIATGINQPSFVYALGQLVYWQPGTNGTNETSLKQQNQRIAIANAKLAPYGRAAMQVITKLGLDPKHLVIGNNVNQVQHFIHSGNAKSGLLALSQLIMKDPSEYWLIPEHYYSAIEQKAVLLRPDKPAARALAEFLSQDTARAIIQASGYKLPDHARPGPKTDV